jgi:hypothetical protein
VSLRTELDADLPHASALAPEFCGAFAQCLPFGRNLSSGLRGAEELIEIRVGSKVPDDGLHRAHMQAKSVRNGRSGESVKEVSTADLETSVNRASRLLKNVCQYLGASHAQLSVI